MKVFYCNRDWNSLLTCFYEAWTSKEGFQNIRIEYEPITQYSLFDEYLFVDACDAKAVKVMDAINLKISKFFYQELAYTSMSYEEDVPNVLYRMMLLGFRYGNQTFDMMQYKEVLRYREIRKKLSSEINHFQEFSRFNVINNKFLIAHIEPKSYILPALGPIFADRMPSENYSIIDDSHHEALVHNTDDNFYIYKLSYEEYESLKRTESISDEYTKMWKSFFNTIAIKERENKKCQRNLMPIWTRKHAVEFAK